MANNTGQVGRRGIEGGVVKRKPVFKKKKYDPKIAKALYGPPVKKGYDKNKKDRKPENK